MLGDKNNYRHNILDASLHIGIAQIDNDHTKMYELISRLELMLDAQQTIAASMKTINELVQFTNYHFDREKKIMVACQYPHLKAHLLSHQEDLKKLQAYVNDYSEGKLSLVKFIQQLNLWFRKHIQSIDKNISQYAIGYEVEIRRCLEVVFPQGTDDLDKGIARLKNVIIIDDDPHFSKMLMVMIKNSGFSSKYYNDARDYFASKSNHNDIIFLDLNMPTMDGVEVIRKLAENNSHAQLVLLSGYDSGIIHSAQTLAEEQNLNVLASLTKPIRPKELKELLDKANQEKTKQERQQDQELVLPTADDLQRAINDKQLILHYQPQVDVKTGKLVGVEALVRWQRTEHSLTMPNIFIPLAEKNGLMDELTSEVMLQAVEQIKNWKESGLSPKVSINISAENITSLSLPEKLERMVKDNQLDPSKIVFEITETALMKELVTSLDILTRLRMKHFNLSIDDFGTGYSSLVQLHRIPFTELKIDQSFIMQMEMDEEALGIVETCIMLGHKLKMKVVAEGVESEKVLNKLADFGCDIAQGYYIAKPMPADDLLKWAKKQKLGSEGDL